MERIHFKPGETREFFFLKFYVYRYCACMYVLVCTYVCLHTTYMPRNYGGQEDIECPGTGVGQL